MIAAEKDHRVNKNPLEQQVLIERWAQRVFKVKQGPMVWHGLMK
jgi:hypothetical protein